MDFELTEELKMLKEMARKFALAEIAPVAQECDEHEKYLPEIRKKAAQNGLVGAWISEEYGGSGAGILGNTIITEELSRVDMGIALNVVAAGFGCESIHSYGSEEQKKLTCRLFVKGLRSAPALIRNQMPERTSPAIRQGR
jgi:acyl-CoA dehydrogenase